VADSASTGRLREIWARDAAVYDRWMRRLDRLVVGDGRRWLCAQAYGRVLEVAVGTGLNLPFYPSGVALTGVDLSPETLAIARGRARALGRAVTLVEADAQALPFPDAGFDTVVCCLGLCTIPDDRAAVAQMRRVLRPGGRLLLLDHVESDNRLVRAVQRRLDGPSRRHCGDHLTRRPSRYLAEAGFAVQRRERYRAGMVERLSATAS
jgi:ubiquinone/menaquinone biosynthesis C-methylase UbiE